MKQQISFHLRYSETHYKLLVITISRHINWKPNPIILVSLNKSLAQVVEATLLGFTLNTPVHKCVRPTIRI